MSTIGIMYKQPRVFAHDTWPVVIGAINYTWNINKKVPPSSPLSWAGILVTNTGNGGANPYVAGDTITLSPGSGSVPGVLTVDAVDAAGLITDWSFDPTTVTNLGVGYRVGDSLTQAATSGAGLGFQCDITNIDIPNTQEAGCCLYFSPAAAAAASFSVIMEAGRYDGSGGDGYPASEVRTFQLVPVGTFMPVLVKQITTVIASTGDILALY